MDIQQETDLTALIHPVSTLIISNHFVRTVLISEDKYVQVVGALLGKQNTRTIEIQNCFEIETKVENGIRTLNLEYFREREKMFQETFPDQAFLGFYVTGDHKNIDDFDIKLQEQALQITDFAILLKLNPLAENSGDKVELNRQQKNFQVPVAVYDANVCHETGKTIFNSIHVKIVSDAAERIGTDHAAKFTASADKTETTAAKKMNEQASALSMLLKGLTIAHEYLKAVEEKKFAADPEILRELHKLSIKISFLKKGLIKDKSGADAIERVMLFLSMGHKNLSTLFSLASKVNVIVNEAHSTPYTSAMKRKENTLSLFKSETSRSDCSESITDK